MSSMLKNSTITMYAWVGADNSEEIEKNMDSFLSRISTLKNILISEKKHDKRTWKNKQIIYYVYVKLSYPYKMNDAIWSASRLAYVSLSIQSPV